MVEFHVKQTRDGFEELDTKIMTGILDLRNIVREHPQSKNNLPHQQTPISSSTRSLRNVTYLQHKHLNLNLIADS